MTYKVNGPSGIQTAHSASETETTIKSVSNTPWKSIAATSSVISTITGSGLLGAGIVGGGVTAGAAAAVTATGMITGGTALIVCGLVVGAIAAYKCWKSRKNESSQSTSQMTNHLEMPHSQKKKPLKADSDLDDDDDDDDKKVVQEAASQNIKSKPQSPKKSEPRSQGNEHIFAFEQPSISGIEVCDDDDDDDDDDDETVLTYGAGVVGFFPSHASTDETGETGETGETKALGHSVQKSIDLRQQIPSLVRTRMLSDLSRSTSKSSASLMEKVPAFALTKTLNTQPDTQRGVHEGLSEPGHLNFTPKALLDGSKVTYQRKIEKCELIQEVDLPQNATKRQIDAWAQNEETEMSYKENGYKVTEQHIVTVEPLEK